MFSIYMSTYMRITYPYIDSYRYIDLSIYICRHSCLSVCLSIYLYIYIYIYMYIHSRLYARPTTDAKKKKMIWPLEK